MTNPAHTPVALEVDDLAQEIRRVDGSNELGAGALAEAIMPFLRTYLSAACGEAGDMGDPHSPYMRIVTFFDQDDTAGSFLNEDGEGGFTGAVYRMAREIDALRAESELARLKAQPVVVKALEWPEECPRGRRVHVWPGIPGYTIVHYGGDGEGTIYRWACDGSSWSEPFDAYDTAKAAAQADYERRILSALAAPVSQPANPAHVTDALDRLEAIIRELAGEVAPNGPEDRAWAIINDLRQALTAAIGAGGQAVQDTWFTDRALPVKAMSGDVEDNRVLRLHFRRPVTDDDRKAMCDALNLHQASLAALTAPVSQEPVAWRVKDFADGWILYHSETAARTYAKGVGDAYIQPLYASPQPISEGEPSDAEVERLRQRIAGELPNLFWEPNERGGLGTLRIRAHETGMGEVIARNVTMEHGKLIVAALLAAKSKGGQADG